MRPVYFIAVGSFLAGIGAACNYVQMSRLDDFSTANWLIVIGWLLASLVLAGVAWFAGGLASVPVNALTPAVHGPAGVPAVQQLRAEAKQHRKRADDLDAQAKAAVAVMEADLNAARALLEVQA